MKLIRIKLIRLFLLALVLIVFLMHNIQAARATKQNLVPAQVTTPVQAVKVVMGNIPQQLQSLGTLIAPNTVTLSSDADGRVKAIYFKNGQHVTKGMPVVQLDDTSAQVAYNKAVAQLNADQSKLTRQLSAGDAISQQDIDDSKAKVQSDKADVQSTQAALDQLKITAPFTGVLGAFKLNVGDYTTAGSPIVTLVNTGLLQVNYHLPAENRAQISRGQSVSIRADTLPHQTFSGSVTYIAPTVDAATRTIAVQAMVPNPKALLLPGDFVHVSQYIGQQKNVLVIPQIAVTANVKGYQVYRITNGRLHAVQVQIGNRFSDKVAVTQGLQAGDVVVTSDQQALQDGMQVTATIVPMSALHQSPRPKSAPTTPPAKSPAKAPAKSAPTTPPTKSTTPLTGHTQTAAPPATASMNPSTPSTSPQATTPPAQTIAPSSSKTSPPSAPSNASPSTVSGGQ